MCRFLKNRNPQEPSRADRSSLSSRPGKGRSDLILSLTRGIFLGLSLTTFSPHPIAKATLSPPPDPAGGEAAVPHPTAAVVAAHRKTWFGCLFSREQRRRPHQRQIRRPSHLWATAAAPSPTSITVSSGPVVVFLVLLDVDFSWMLDQIWLNRADYNVHSTIELDWIKPFKMFILWFYGI